MRYRQKVTVLLCLAAVLTCGYILTLVFDPERSGRRSDAYTWLDPGLRDSVDRVDFNGGESGRSMGALSLLRRNGRWVALREGIEYPAREARVDELLDLLSRRASYPRRSDSSAGHGLFGLSETTASRITLRGGAGLPLLDLLIGTSDSGGGSLYMRKAGGSEVRSGDGGLSAYIDNEPGSWYDLRLFPETGEGRVTPDLVQRLTVFLPAQALQDAWTEGLTMLISRVGNGWRIDAGDRSPDPGDIEKSRVDSYISGILATTGDDFVPPPVLSGEQALILELGDGRVLSLHLGPPGEDGQRQAWIFGPLEGRGGVTEPAYGYALAAWALDRIFRPPEYFKK
ncbi:MAG: DUF4340 domain-containing protein [Treponema sp.]|jgi:hypothetical protein|nr:DUF4340 domain-containing protein [Treponema sp.]